MYKHPIVFRYYHEAQGMSKEQKVLFLKRIFVLVDNGPYINNNKPQLTYM